MHLASDVVKAIKVVGVPWGFNEEQLKKASRIALRKAHPDMGGGNEEFDRVNNAVECLKNYLTWVQNGGTRHTLYVHDTPTTLKEVKI